MTPRHQICRAVKPLKIYSLPPFPYLFDTSHYTPRRFPQSLPPNSLLKIGRNIRVFVDSDRGLPVDRQR